MPGIIEEIVSRLAAIEKLLDEISGMLRDQSRPVCPMTPAEEVWADGPLSVKEAAEFLHCSQATVFELLRSGVLVSALDGRRYIAKRGCVRYLLANEEQHPRELQASVLEPIAAPAKKGKK